MKQEVGSHHPVTVVSEEDEPEPNSPDYIQDHDSSNQDGDEEEEGPIDLRKKPNDRNKMAASPIPGPQPDHPNQATADALLGMWQRTLLSAGIHPYLSPLLFLGGATGVSAAKGSAQSGFPFDMSSPESLPQAPIVCDPFGGRHLVMRSPDGNVVALPLGGASKYYENAKEPVSNQQYRNCEPPQAYSHKKQTAPNSNRGKSELVSRLESAPVANRMEYESRDERDYYRIGRYEPEDLSRLGDSSSEDTRNEDSPDDRRWAAPPDRYSMARSKSCSELPVYDSPPDGRVSGSGRVSPVSSFSCPSASTSRVRSWHSPEDRSNRKRKHTLSEHVTEMEDEEEEQGIVNAPITRLLNPKKPKMPRLIRMEDPKRTHKYYDPYEEYQLKRAQLSSQDQQHCLTPEQEETFLERLRHSAPLGVPWNVYSYYTQMMENLTHHSNPRDRMTSPPPQRTMRSFPSSVSPSPATTPTPVSPPMVSSTTVPTTAPLNSVAQNGADSRKASRVLTGKHVRQGTGASPSTLMTLRQKIQERQKAKEVTFNPGFNNKNSREPKKRNHVHAPAGVLNKGR